MEERRRLVTHCQRRPIAQVATEIRVLQFVRVALKPVQLVGQSGAVEVPPVQPAGGLHGAANASYAISHELGAQSSCNPQPLIPVSPKKTIFFETFQSS